MSSLKDVANLAQVSMMTVSRVINGSKAVRPDTRKKVEEAIKTLKYVPDLSARKMRSQGKFSTIAILAEDTATTPFSVEVLLAIEETSRKHGWNSFLINILSAEDRNRAVRLLLSQRPDGIIYTTMGLRNVNLPQELSEQNVIFANCVTNNSEHTCYIPDDFNGQYQAVQYLIKQGYKKPLCFWLPEFIIASKERYAGFKAAWEEAGLPLADTHQYFMAGHDDYHHLDPIIDKHIVNGKADFDVVICGNDRAAFIAYQKLLGKGLSIPKEVGVLGYDNLVGVGNLFLPPLSTVQLPHREIGQEAALHIIENRSCTGYQYIPCPFLHRESL